MPLIPYSLTALKGDGRIFPVDLDEDSLPAYVFPRDEADSTPDEIT